MLLLRLEAAAAKGKYLRSVSIATTMGPGIKLASTKLGE